MRSKLIHRDQEEFFPAPHRTRLLETHQVPVIEQVLSITSDKIHQLEEPEQPGQMSATADCDPYAEYVRQSEMCQLGTLTFERFQPRP